MIPLELLERVPYQPIVNRLTLAHFIGKAAAYFCNRCAAIAVFPNHSRRAIQAMCFVSLLVIDQQFICELAHD